MESPLHSDSHLLSSTLAPFTLDYRADCYGPSDEKQHSDTQTREPGNRSMPASWGGNTGKEHRLGEGWD